VTAMSRDQLRELSPDATRAVREMIQRKRQGQDGTCPRPAKPAQQLRQLGDIRRNPPRLILAEQLGGRNLEI